jgi:hypothetical protein
VYLGIDFLISANLRPFVVEVNVGLPGGAQEYDLTHLVFYGRSSGIFDKIEKTSARAYGKGFQKYISSLPFIESLKPFKIWMDGQGPYPPTFHPGLRLEDKWIQYQILNRPIPMPETKIFNPLKLSEAEEFLERKRALVLKRRVGRGGRGFQVIGDREVLANADLGGRPALLQEFIESRVDGFVFSIRSVAFGGEFMCMYANLACRANSNHGILAHVMARDRFGLADHPFQTQKFNQKSWEAELWFGRDEPAYLRHNLYEDEVAQTALILPRRLYRTLQSLSVKIERIYEGLDLSNLPSACFEDKKYY